MALFDTIPSQVIGALVALGILYLIIRAPKWIETRTELRETAAAGANYQKVRTGLESTRQSLRKTRAEEQLTRSQTITADKAVSKAEQTSETASEVEERTTELAETIEASVATLQNQATDIQTSLAEKTASLQAVDKEILEIESLKRKLQPLAKLTKIDQTTTKFLKEEYFTTVSEKLQNIIDAETTNEQHHRTFLDKIKERIDNLKSIETVAKTELNNLKKKESKEYNNFQNEFKALKKTITDKYKQLAKEKSKGKQADNNLLAQISKEIEMLQRNAASLQELNKQIEKTSDMMQLELSQLQQILEDIINIVKKEQKYAKTIDRREKVLKKRLNEISKKQTKITENIKQLNSPEQLYPVILKYSQQIEEFYTFYITILQEDFTFEQKLKEIITQNIIILNKGGAFITLLTSLEESEKALDIGLESILSLMNTIFTVDVQVSLQKERKNIEKASLLIDYEEKVEKYLQALEEIITKQNKEELAEIDVLLEKEKQNVAEVQAFQKQLAQELGQAMATSVNRKIALDENYMNQASKFADQLKQRNQTAAATYKKTLSL